ncbi:hypothetical protein HMPREF1870_00219 [Bacteroidales bacterium KA00344]|nr:hypothetical protein HMPREF1870_00219 [Bacteroidales bacterium KA00344]
MADQNKSIASLQKSLPSYLEVWRKRSTQRFCLKVYIYGYYLLRF